MDDLVLVEALDQLVLKENPVHVGPKANQGHQETSESQDTKERLEHL